MGGSRTASTGGTCAGFTGIGRIWQDGALGLSCWRLMFNDLLWRVGKAYLYTHKLCLLRLLLLLMFVASWARMVDGGAWLLDLGTLVLS